MRLLELLIGIVILGILTSFGVNGFSKYRAGQEMSQAVDIVADALGRAKTETVASRAASQYGVKFATSTVTLFKGGTYVAGAATNIVYDLPSSVSVGTTTLTGGGTVVIFKRLTGSTDTSGTIMLDSVRGDIPDRTVQILTTGVVSIQ